VGIKLAGCIPTRKTVETVCFSLMLDEAYFSLQLTGAECRTDWLPVTPSIKVTLQLAVSQYLGVQLTWDS
jgi:hypothetical protein